MLCDPFFFSIAFFPRDGTRKVFTSRVSFAYQRDNRSEYNVFNRGVVKAEFRSSADTNNTPSVHVIKVVFASRALLNHPEKYLRSTSLDEFLSYCTSVTMLSATRYRRCV